MNLTIEENPHNMLPSVITTMCYSLTVILPANAYVLWLIQQAARLAPDIFYFNLSAEEILSSLVTIVYFLGYHDYCPPCIEAFVFCCGLFFTARPLFQCLICLECYLGVNHPVWFLRLKPLRYRLACCALSWLLVAISCIYFKSIHRNHHHLFTFFIQSLLFLFVVIFCLVSVLRTLKRPGPGENNAQKKSNRAKTRAFKIVLATMVSLMLNFLLCIAPIPLQFWMPRVKFMLVYRICICLSFIIGSMQPLIYLQRSEKILCLRLH